LIVISLFDSSWCSGGTVSIGEYCGGREFQNVDLNCALLSLHFKKIGDPVVWKASGEVTDTPTEYV